MALDINGAMDQIDRAVANALNKAATAVRRQAMLNCPVDTGTLRRSIQQTKASVYDHEVSIFSNVEYAPYVEYGTSKQAAQPFLMPAVESVNIAGYFENIL